MIEGKLGRDPGHGAFDKASHKTVITLLNTFHNNVDVALVLEAISVHYKGKHECRNENHEGASRLGHQAGQARRSLGSKLN